MFGLNSTVKCIYTRLPWFHYAGIGSSAHNESETIAKYEIMDGAPVRGENIPIR
jgi:hypothetical protein